MSWKIMIGESSEILDQKNIPNRVNLTFLDPPFNQDKNYKKWDDQLPDEIYWKWMTDV